MNQLRRISGNCLQKINMYQFIRMNARNSHKMIDASFSKHKKEEDKGMNLLRVQQNKQSELQEQKNQEDQVKYMAEKSDVDFQKEYKKQHYSKKRAVNDVVESLFFQDHTEQVQYEYLKHLKKDIETDEIDTLQNETSQDSYKEMSDLKISETEIKNNFDSLQNFLEEDLELTNGQYKKLFGLSSSAKTAVQSDGSISMKRVPENSLDILPIIENIHLNCHLLAFFVKYQKFFFSMQYYALINKIKQNVDDLEYIKEFEMEKYEQKRKALHAVNPQAKLKYKPVFLDLEETKAHFGYQILQRNLKQKFGEGYQISYQIKYYKYKKVLYDITKSLSILKALVAFDKQLSDDYYELVEKKFNEQKKEFTLFELVAYQFLLAAQCEKHKVIMNNDIQLKVLEEMLSRDESEFTNQILNLIVKLRVMYPLFTIYKTNHVLSRMQMQFTRQISNFTTKQLLEIAMTFLINNIHFHKYFAEILFISIFKNLPQEKTVKSKPVIQILRYFKKKQLYYFQRIESDDSQQAGNKESQQNNIIDDDELSGDVFQIEQAEGLLKNSVEEEDDFLIDATNVKEDSMTQVFKNSMKTGLKIDGLFDALLSSIIREISSGLVIKPFSLNQLINIMVNNQVNKQAYYDLFISEFAKIIPKSNFLMFAKMYQVLSDQRLIQKPLHILSAAKIKKNLKSEYVTYQKTQQLLLESYNTQQNIQNKPNTNKYESRQISEKQIKLTRLLLYKLSFCTSNLWSYIFNNVRFDMVQQTDQDTLSSTIIYANSLIADIDKYLDSSMNTSMTLIQTIQQINNFIELEMKKVVPPMNVSKLVSNVHINIIDEDNLLKYSTRLDLLYQLHKRYFNLKYQPYIEKNALVDNLIFDIELKNQETSSATLLNFINYKSYNYQGQERGITYLKRHFAKVKGQKFIMIDFKEFEKYIVDFFEENETEGKNIPNFIESSLIEESLPKDLKLPEEIQKMLSLFEEQINQIYKECKHEYDQSKQQDLSKKEQKQNKFQKYSNKNKLNTDKASKSQVDNEDTEGDLVDDMSKSTSDKENKKNDKFDQNKNNQNKQTKNNNKYYSID